MSNYIIPGSYVENKKSEPVITVNSTPDNALFSGVFKKGQFGKVISITSPTVFEQAFGNELKQPNTDDFFGGYFLSNKTSNLLMTRALHYEEVDEVHTPSSESDQTSFFGWKRQTSEPIYKVITPYDLTLLSNSRLTKKFIQNNLLDDETTYVSTSTYNIGDTVVVNGVKWIATADNLTGAWTGNDWIEIPTSIDTWNGKITYSFGDIVDKSGTKYVCKVNSVSSSDVTPPSSSFVTAPAVLSNIPDWVVSHSYAVGDLAKSGTTYKICKIAHDSDDFSFSNDTYWLTLVFSNYTDWNYHQVNDIVSLSINNVVSYWICLATISAVSQPSEGAEWKEFQMPLSQSEAINIRKWDFKGTFSGAISYSRYDVVEYNSETYIAKVNMSPASWNALNWNKLYPINVIETGKESDLGYYVFTGKQSDFGSDLQLNKIQEYTQPCIVFENSYNVKNVMRETLTSGIQFTIILQEGQTVEKMFEQCQLKIKNKSIPSFSILSENTIQFTVQPSLGVTVKKGDIFTLNGIIEGTDTEKLNSIFFYDKDVENDLSNTQFHSTIEGVGECHGLYNPYDETFMSSKITASGLDSKGIVAFAKSGGEWGNNISVMLIGKEFWESDYNSYKYLYPYKDLKSHELIFIVMEGESIVENFLVSIDENALNDLKLKYYIDDVVNSGSNYVSVKYYGGSFEEYEEESTNQINNVFIGDAITVTDWYVTRSEIVGQEHSDTESFKYKVEIVNSITPQIRVYINDTDVTSDLEFTGNLIFSHNGYRYTVSGTLTVGNYVEWNSYHQLDASGIRIKFTLENGVTSKSHTVDDRVKAYSLFNAEEITGLLMAGGKSFNSADLTTLIQGIENGVLSKRINCFGLFNVPFDIIVNNSDKAEAIASWSNRGGFFISNNNDKYVVYDTYFNVIVKNKKVILPKSFLMLENYFNTFTSPGRQQSIAGEDYGVIGGLDSIVWYPKDDIQVKKLISANINPTVFIPGLGFVNWEHLTFLKSEADENEASVSLSKILVQSELKKAIRSFTFRQLDSQSKFKVESLVKTYLSSKITSKLITRYEYIEVTETNKFTYRVKISVLYPKALKFIVMEFETLQA